jgi:hypothetical protein
MHLSRFVLAFVLIPLLGFAAGACAGGGGGGGSGGSSNVITEEQVANSGANTAYEAVRQLRSRWLQRRGPMSIQDPTPPGPVVYVDGMRFGEVESLQQISARHVTEMRYINARDATTRFGTGHPAGVIMVITQR